MKINITPEVRAVLESSIINATSVQLPSSPLARPLYVAVNKVLEAGGGKWNRSAKAHVFPSDPREILGLALASNVIVDKVKERKKERQAFYTPGALAKDAAVRADVDGHFVLEPSAGGGALADACIHMGAKRMYCIELDAESAAELNNRGHKTVAGDFLALQPETPQDRFARIVMNPPFTRKSDYKHVAHAHRHWLAEDGLLTAIVCDDGQDRADLESIHPSYQVLERLPAGAFKEAGTQIKTLLIQLSK